MHWTKGADFDEAFDSLQSIIAQRSIRGSSGAIRGEWRCICFTEAPQDTFHQVIGKKYKPFGVQVPKSWLFGLGGRPAIYQTSAEYDLLPDQLKWRHVRYEPNASPPIDFSWEREWRICAESVTLEPATAHILVPNESWAERIICDHQEHEQEYIDRLASEYGEEYRMYPHEQFAFTYSAIDA